jgi:FixJ family two-component response regulator
MIQGPVKDDGFRRPALGGPMSVSHEADPKTVFVVDDDPAIRGAVIMLLETEGYRAFDYGSAEEFVSGYRPVRPACLLLDLQMPGMSGLDLQQLLDKRDIRLPIIFITGHGDVRSSAQAFRSGAVDFLQKPFRDDELLERVGEAIEIDREANSREQVEGRASALMARLTPREKEVMELMMAGDSNKEIARVLDVSHRTVEVHRGRVLRKMECRTLPDLLSLAVGAGLLRPPT